MPHSPHWNPVPSKDDLTSDVNDLLAELGRDPTEQLKHPERIAKSDLLMLSRVLDTIKVKGVKGTGFARFGDPSPTTHPDRRAG